MVNPHLKRNQGENNPMYGKKHSDSTKAKMSKSQSLRLDEIRHLINEVNTGRLDSRIREIVKETLDNYISTQTTISVDDKKGN